MCECAAQALSRALSPESCSMYGLVAEILPDCSKGGWVEQLDSQNLSKLHLMHRFQALCIDVLDLGIITRPDRQFVHAVHHVVVLNVLFSSFRSTTRNLSLL